MMELDKLAGLAPSIDERAVEAELAAYVEGGEVVERWTIDGPAAADWAMARLAEIHGRAQVYEAEASLWQEAAGKITRAGEWFIERLKEWGVASRSTSAKTFTLPHGVVRTTERQPKIKVVDEGAAIEWARKTYVASNIDCPECEGTGIDQGTDGTDGRDPSGGPCTDCIGGKVAVTLAEAGAVKTTPRFLVSEVRDAAVIEPLVVAWVSTAKADGALERIEVAPVRFTAERLATVQERLGDGYVVEAECVPAVFDRGGQRVPGLEAEPGHISATVTPSNLLPATVRR